MNAVTQARKAIAAQQARKALYVIRYFPATPANPGVEWRLYTTDMRALLAGGFMNTAAAARRDAEHALRVRIENPEQFAHELNEKAAA